jgi:hypothetical protein
MTGPENDLIRAYLRDGPEELSERAYVAMRGAVERVPQRGRRPWAAWRLDDQRMRYALVAAVIAAALFATWRLLPNPTIYGPGGATPTPSPTQTPTPAQTSPPPSGFPLPTTIGECSLTLTELREVRGGDPEAPTPFLMSPPYRAAMLPHTGQPSAALIQADGTGWGEDGPGRPVVSVVRPDATLDYPGVSLAAGQLSTSYAFDTPGRWALSMVAESVGCTQIVEIIVDPEPSPTPPPSAQLEPSP